VPLVLGTITMCNPNLPNQKDSTYPGTAIISDRMDTKAADKINLHLDALTTKALSAFKRQMLYIYARGHYREFIPEFMVNDMVRAAESSASQLLVDAVSEISGISTAPASFTMIDMAMNAYVSDLQGVVEQGRGVPLHPPMLKVAGERFDAVRQRLVRHLDNHRPSFVEPKNKGGRPLTWGLGRRTDPCHGHRQYAGRAAVRARSTGTDSGNHPGLVHSDRRRCAC